jgi:hypothetical protein
MDRTRDIVKLREAARLCRLKVAKSGPGSEEFERLAAEIDGLIAALTTETAARRSRKAGAELR